MKIKGKIFEIVPPSKHDRRMLPYSPHRKSSPFYGFHYVTVSDANIDIKTFKSVFRRMIWKMRHKREKYNIWEVVMKNCPYVEGELIEIDVERYCEPTDIFIKQDKIKKEEK